MKDLSSFLRWCHRVKTLLQRHVQEALTEVRNNVLRVVNHQVHSQMEPVHRLTTHEEQVRVLVCLSILVAFPRQAQGCGCAGAADKLLRSWIKQGHVQHQVDRFQGVLLGLAAEIGARNGFKVHCEKLFLFVCRKQVGVYQLMVVLQPHVGLTGCVVEAQPTGVSLVLADQVLQVSGIQSCLWRDHF